MKKSHTATILALIIVLIIAFIIFHNYSRTQTQTPVAPTPTPTASVTVAYACDGGKSVQAAYYQGETVVNPADPNQPPTPSGNVQLALSDGRSMTLPQTISADGTRYANADESFVFWSKGNGALVLENNQEQTYMGCTTVNPDPGTLPQIYQNGTNGITLRYPTGYTVDDTYKYQALGPGKDILGAKFTIPATLASGTNLSSDSYISVEEIPKTTTCSAALFLSPGAIVSNVSDNGVDYSSGTTSDAGAGNRYEETVYAIPGTNPCIGVRYYIHYSAIENYPAGSVTEFDKQALLDQFDQIRRTLVVNQ